jgi:hypothetical protein
MCVGCFRQGAPVLTSLIDERFSECGFLTQMGVKCIWRILELHGTVPLNHLCRLLAADGLPYRLLRALNAIVLEMLASPPAMQVRSDAVNGMRISPPFPSEHR